MKLIVTAVATGLLLLATTARAENPQVGIDPDEITVSGISSGGSMAHQLHIAFPDIFSGAGIIAGAPYGCAAGAVATAFARCIAQAGPDLDAASVAAQVRAAHEGGEIENPELLADDRAWVFHAQLDAVVAQGVVDVTADLYRQFLPAENVQYVTDVAAAHTFPTLDQGTACDVSETPWLGACDYDTAGALLQFLYPGIKQPVDVQDAAPVEVEVKGSDAGLSDVAWLVVPPACASTEAKCALHIVLHGCQQSQAQVGMQFIENSGYVRWAKANDIVLAFPQVVASPVNPLGCWDWWGYTGADYLTRSGTQMSALVEWVQGIAASGD